jgi:hypothetical protein
MKDHGIFVSDLQDNEVILYIQILKRRKRNIIIHQMSQGQSSMQHP